MTAAPSPESPASSSASSSTASSSYSVGSGRYYELGRMTTSGLETVFLRGTMPKLDRLADWEFRGMNHPAWAKLAGIKKFVKGFFYEGDTLFGYNYSAIQNGIEMPWIAKNGVDSPKRFGFYEVAPVDSTAKDNAYLNSVLLDYGKGGNSIFDPSKGLRDYLVQVDPDNEDLYLGKAYYAIGPVRLSTNFFILERHRPAVGTVHRP